MKKLLFSLLAGIAMMSCANDTVCLQVKTKQGTLEGFEQDGVKTFLGIPFAQAPVGELRWKAPQAPLKWEGVREAKTFGNDPMQPDIYGDMSFRGPKRSEDCLYLNVWTTAKTTKDKLPVLIYFNGGGLMAGSGSEPRYDGAAISREGVIGVTANYREGVFGFLAHPELTAESAYGGSGNYGFLDQVAAIDWVKDNISVFGGDPDRITIVGESAGSFSVSLLMVSPLSKGKIAGAMLSSGAEVIPYAAEPQAKAEADGKAYLKSKGLMSIAEARALDADKLQELLPPNGMHSVVLDGYFMTETPDSIYEKGEQAKVPLLAGWNSLEGTPLQALAGQEPTLENYKKAMSARFGDMTDEIFEAYGLLADADVVSQKGIDLASDLFTGFPTWKACDYHAKTSGQPVFRYKYNHPRPEVSAKMGDKVAALAGGVREKTTEEKAAGKKPVPVINGAVHSADIEYAMGTLPTNRVFDWQPEDYMISEIFSQYYANFVKTGNPNGLGLVEWPVINGQEVAPVLQIDVNTVVKADAQMEKRYDFIDKLFWK